MLAHDPNFNLEFVDSAGGALTNAVKSAQGDFASGRVPSRRAQLHERRRFALRRRSRRMAARLAILISADVLALVLTRFVLVALLGAGGSPPDALREFRAGGPLADPGTPASLVLWIALLVSLMVTGAYARHRGLNTWLRLAAAAILAGGASAVPLAAVIGWQQAVSQMLIVAGAAFVALVFARLAAERILRRVWPRARGAAPAILLGPPDAATSALAVAATAAGGDYKVALHREINPQGLGDPTALAIALGREIDDIGIEAVILTELVPERYLRAVVDEALSAGCLVLCPPRAVAVDGLRPRLVWHHDQAFLEFGTPVLQLSALIVKRTTDVIGAGLLLLLVSPLMLLIALGIKLDSPGPVFFSQDRAGVGGRRFRMLKFRTMRRGADDQKQDLAHLNYTGDVRLFKIPFDPRVTRFGSFLRRWSLDELPQFWNVLRGDMSLVGPRPFFESDFAAYEDHHFRRLDTKPGITGLWQVGGRSDLVEFEDVVYLDRQYIENWSFWLDLGILLRTMPTVIRRKGAY